MPYVLCTPSTNTPGTGKAPFSGNLRARLKLSPKLCSPLNANHSHLYHYYISFKALCQFFSKFSLFPHLFCKISSLSSSVLHLMYKNYVVDIYILSYLQVIRSKNKTTRISPYISSLFRSSHEVRSDLTQII